MYRLNGPDALNTLKESLFEGQIIDCKAIRPIEIGVYDCLLVVYDFDSEIARQVIATVTALELAEYICTHLPQEINYGD